MNFVTNTKELRKKMIDNEIYSQTELSNRTGITKNTLCSIFTGKSNPSSIVIYKLINTLNLSPEEAGRIFLVADYATGNTRGEIR